MTHVERLPLPDGSSAYRLTWAGNGLRVSEDDARELYAQLGLALAETRNESAQVDAQIGDEYAAERFDRMIDRAYEAEVF